MATIETDKHVFFDDSGNLLTNGQIYIGQPDTDPRTNQKTVTFEDSAGGQFTAQQPLKTRNGKISYNGKPIKALVDGEHSMLILDSAGKQVDYSSSITPPDSGAGGSQTFDELVRVGLTLTEIKGFDVAVGDAVKNVGKATIGDNLGADWYVVSNTGNTADDVDLIDFDNGLQGKRNKSYSYSKDVTASAGTFILDDPVNVLSTDNANSYRSTWTSVDASGLVPDEASAILMKGTLEAAYGNNTTASDISVILSIRRSGSTISPNDFDGAIIAEDGESQDTNASVKARAAGSHTVAKTVGDPASFEVYIVVNDPTAGANNTSPRLDLQVVGYIINAEDLT